MTGAGGSTTLYRYTPSGRLWQVEDALGGVTEYGYDQRGNREMVRDANGHETWFDYDLMDRLVREVNPVGGETVFTYDAAGNRASKLDPKGNLITYQHDENRRLTDIIYPDATRTHFDFDERGNKVYEENPSVSRSYTYTDLNQVETVTDHVLDKTLAYAYGPNGQRTRLEGPSGEVSEYRYDALNRIRELVDPDGGRTVFAYSPAGRRDSLTFPNGVEGTYLWDQAGRLESIVYAKGAGDVLSSFTYTHDDAGNRLSKTLASGGSESYGYDDLNRLTSATYPSGRSVTYDYDPVGNRNFVIEQFAGGSSETTTYTYSDFNQVLSTTISQGTTDYGWDDNGNLVSKETPLGALTQYSYNFENRLSSILFPSGQTNAFGYDPQGIRTFKQDSAGLQRFLVDGVSVLAAFDGGGVQKTWLNHNPQRIDEVISQVQEAGKLFHLVDGLGSVYGLVNQAGVKVASYGYDAYGALIDAQVEPGLKNYWLFTGREMDADSGWQYNRARYYLADVGLWSREDPRNPRSLNGVVSQGVLESRFHAPMAPTSEIDPSGLITISSSRSVSTTASLGAGYSASETFVEHNLDTDGSEMFTETVGEGVTIGFSADVAHMTSSMFTNAPTVCELLGPADIYALNGTIGAVGYLGSTLFIWSSPPYQGIGTGIMLGAGVQFPLNYSIDFLKTYTTRVGGATCALVDRCPCDGPRVMPAG